MIFFNYKYYIIVKYLVGISFFGVIIFVLEGWFGKILDCYLKENCGLISLFELGDSVMVDKGFIIVDLLEK